MAGAIGYANIYDKDNTEVYEVQITGGDQSATVQLSGNKVIISHVNSGNELTIEGSPSVNTAGITAEQKSTSSIEITLPYVPTSIRYFGGQSEWAGGSQSDMVVLQGETKTTEAANYSSGGGFMLQYYEEQSSSTTQKAISLENLEEFKAKCDSAYVTVGGSSVQEITGTKRFTSVEGIVVNSDESELAGNDTKYKSYSIEGNYAGDSPFVLNIPHNYASATLAVDKGTYPEMTAGNADKVSHSLVIGGYSYDGSEDVTVPVDNFGLKENEIISRSTSEPTAAGDSADFVDYDSSLYYKGRTFSEDLSITRNIAQLAQASNTIKAAPIGDKVFLFDSTNTDIYVFDTTNNSLTALSQKVPANPYLVESYNGNVLIISGSTLYTFNPETYEFAQESVLFVVNESVKSAHIGNKLFYYSVSGGSAYIYQYDLELKTRNRVWTYNNDWNYAGFCANPETGKLYLLGGYYTVGSNNTQSYQNVTNEIDSKTGDNVYKEAMPVTLNGFNCALIGGYIYTFGGRKQGTVSSIISNIYRYDITHDSWNLVSGAQVAENSINIAIAVIGEQTFLFGGGNYPYSSISTISEISVFNVGGYVYDYRKLVDENVLPIPTASDAGKVPTVNAAGDAYELQTPQSGGGIGEWVKNVSALPSDGVYLICNSDDPEQETLDNITWIAYHSANSINNSFLFPYPDGSYYYYRVLKNGTIGQVKSDGTNTTTLSAFSYIKLK